MRNRKLIAAAGMTAALGTGSLIGVALGTPVVSGAQETTTEGTTTQQDRRPGAGRRGGPDLEVAAETLGLSTDDLRAALHDGSTLAEIAEEQGVETRTLVDALVAEAEARLDEVRAELPERIAQLVESGGRFGGRGGHGPGGGFGGPAGRGTGPGFEAAADVLGLSTDEMAERLRDGDTLADIAGEQGVEVQSVIDALVAEAQEKLATAVESGRLTQEEADERLADLEERITEMVTEGRPGRRGGD